ncbi:MAG TPA: hypothetical protein V6D00_05765 [Pantanalinema sp.]
MIAYFVTDPKVDTIVIPEADLAVEVNRQTLMAFLGDSPAFAGWSGQALGDRAPTAFGRVIAQREDDRSPTILDQTTWNQRVFQHLRR